ncbi:hypothetical protein E1301_Tti021649 [Triplophysa tibetana]|uniref:Uncharacterized protein n=1 Tax=Triplophysa tibetana TaxID=1572043 RepID=A0A5A9PPF5_9TELE|nr:hypothetical protein E1301_Tti021649 [Triplophysa tibetana]
MRQDNALLCGLWFGDEKPQMRTFLKLFVDECVKPEDSGFTWEMDNDVFIITKGIPLVLTAKKNTSVLGDYTGLFGVIKVYERESCLFIISENATRTK